MSTKNAQQVASRGRRPANTQRIHATISDDVFAMLQKLAKDHHRNNLSGAVEAALRTYYNARKLGIVADAGEIRSSG